MVVVIRIAAILNIICNAGIGTSGSANYEFQKSII